MSDDLKSCQRKRRHNIAKSCYVLCHKLAPGGFYSNLAGSYPSWGRHHRRRRHHHHHHGPVESEVVPANKIKESGLQIFGEEVQNLVCKPLFQGFYTELSFQQGLTNFVLGSFPQISRTPFLWFAKIASDLSTC